MSGFSDTKPQGTKSPRLNELVDIYQIPSEWGRVRFVGAVTSVYYIWITTETKEGGKANAFPKVCLDYNPKTEELDKEICPYRKNEAGRGQKVYLANAIIRELEENEPRRLPKHTKREEKLRKDSGGNPCYYKEMGSASWTPVRVVRLPSSLVEKLKNFKGLNKHKNKTYDISDAKYGLDVYLRHDPDVKGTDQYAAQMGDKVKLGPKELDYLRYKIEGLLKPESIERAEQDWKNIQSRLWKENDDEPEKKKDNYYDEVDTRRKKKKKKEESEDSESDNPWNNDSDDELYEDDSEVEKKKKKKSRKSSKKRKSSSKRKK